MIAHMIGSAVGFSCAVILMAILAVMWIMRHP